MNREMSQFHRRYAGSIIEDTMYAAMSGILATLRYVRIYSCVSLPTVDARNIVMSASTPSATTRKARFALPPHGREGGEAERQDEGEKSKGRVVNEYEGLLRLHAPTTPSPRRGSPSLPPWLPRYRYRGRQSGIPL